MEVKDEESKYPDRHYRIIFVNGVIPVCGTKRATDDETFRKKFSASLATSCQTCSNMTQGGLKINR